MRVLIVFASTDGHTRKLADFVAERLAARGHEVLMHSASERGLDADPGAFGTVLLMGSLHAGAYQAPLVEYARRHAAKLQALDAAFISVSLSAAGHDRRDWGGLEACVRRFEEQTGWRPRSIHHAAGAFSFTRYGLLKRFIMGRIARQRGLRLGSRRDHDLTDYGALETFACKVVEGGSLAPPIGPLVA